MYFFLVGVLTLPLHLIAKPRQSCGLRFDKKAPACETEGRKVGGLVFLPCTCIQSPFLGNPAAPKRTRAGGLPPARFLDGLGLLLT